MTHRSFLAFLYSALLLIIVIPIAQASIKFSGNTVITKIAPEKYQDSDYWNNLKKDSRNSDISQNQSSKENISNPSIESLKDQNWSSSSKYSTYDASHFSEFAHILIFDRITLTKKEVLLNLNENYIHGNIALSLQSCWLSLPKNSSKNLFKHSLNTEYKSLIRIFDISNNYKEIFHHWLFSKNHYAIFGHPSYDIRLLSCETT